MTLELEQNSKIAEARKEMYDATVKILEKFDMSNKAKAKIVKNCCENLKYWLKKETGTKTRPFLIDEKYLTPVVCIQHISNIYSFGFIRIGAELSKKGYKHYYLHNNKEYPITLRSKEVIEKKDLYEVVRYHVELVYKDYYNKIKTEVTKFINTIKADGEDIINWKELYKEVKNSHILLRGILEHLGYKYTNDKQVLYIKIMKIKK